MTLAHAFRKQRTQNEWGRGTQTIYYKSPLRLQSDLGNIYGRSSRGCKNRRQTVPHQRFGKVNNDISKSFNCTHPKDTRHDLRMARQHFIAISLILQFHQAHEDSINPRFLSLSPCNNLICLMFVCINCPSGMEFI